MGQMDRAELLERERERWTLLQQLLGQVPSSRAEESSLTPEGWSVRDLVWHLASWNDVVATELESMRAGKFDEGFDWNEEENNARFLAAGRSVAYADALSVLETSRSRVIRAMEQLEDVSPRALELFSEPASSHVDDHLPELRRFLGAKICLACDLSEGRSPLPGGLIDETQRWRVEHTVGPLGIGTLIVKPKRHTVHVADLTEEEASELGPLIRRTAALVSRIVEPEQVYVTLWSHTDAVPGHIHWVVQPVTRAQMDEFDDYGPSLQVKMFERGEALDPASVERFATAARQELRSAM
jgi:diadenosine tetraphosphate (Ap4A) HIT family hydrolase